MAANTELQLSQHQQSMFLNEILSKSRVIVIEGISGSGKDTFQAHLREELQGKELYEYSEGEVLQSWNQLQIKGIFELQINFMKIFVNYLKNTVARNGNAVFLLNRFHLSAYALTVSREPKLKKGYDDVIAILQKLPVHVFILKLDQNEIEKRSSHPERSTAWQRFQERIVRKEGFRDRVERYLWQQQVMLEAAQQQQIPYSVIKLVPNPNRQAEWGTTDEKNIFWPGLVEDASSIKRPRRRRSLVRA